MKKKSLIDEANERVSIIKVCQLVGVGASEGYNGKLRCPFGALNHSDGGIDPSFRIYIETNSAYCFACRMYFTPVFLYAKANDKKLMGAALDLLEIIGWKPVSQAQRWAEATEVTETVDVSMLGLALRTYCARVCREWESMQLSPEVSEHLGKCLALLDRVHTPEEAEQWLTACKTYMRRHLEAAQ